jgi:prevent-host-death family protein
MPIHVGAFEAKTKFSELLRKVEQGERFTVTVRGRAVADVIPTAAPSPIAPQQAQPSKWSAEEKEAAYQRLRNPRIQGVSQEEIRAAIEEGRR